MYGTVRTVTATATYLRIRHYILDTIGSYRGPQNGDVTQRLNPALSGRWTAIRERGKINAADN